MFGEQIGFAAMPGSSSLSYGFPGYGGGSSSGPGSAPYLASPGLVYQPPQPLSSSYSPRSPGEAAVHGLAVKVERSPDSQGGSSVGSSSSGRPPSPGLDYQRRPLIPPGYYYPDEMIGMYMHGGQVSSPGEPHISHAWMNAGRLAQTYVTSPGHVTSDETVDGARFNGALSRLV